MTNEQRLRAIAEIIETAEHTQNQPERWFTLTPEEAKRIYRLAKGRDRRVATR